jgi:hypothetical protein
MSEAATTAETFAVDVARPAALAPRIAVAALAVSLGAAALIPGVSAGLGMALVAVSAVLVGVGALGIARLEAWNVACLVAAGALAAAPFYRAATWLVVGDLVLAFGLAAVALGAGRSWRAVAAAPALLVGKMFAGPPAALAGALNALPRPSGPSAMPAVRAAGLAAGLLVVFGLLLASADGAFEQLVQRVAPDAPGLGDLPGRVLIALLALAIAAGLAKIAVTQVRGGAAAPPTSTFAPVEWIAALGALVCLFAFFVAVQFVVLFGGNDHVLSTGGLTYAEYARQGFGQLLAVAVLSIGLIAVAWRYARIERPPHETLLRVLLGSLAVLTMVIVVSALHRLDLYTDAFGATRLRLGAAVTCAWIGVLLGLVLLAVLSRTRAWLPRAVVLVTAAFALGFTVANPDARIAERNVDRYERTSKLDPGYAASLSADAVPELAKLPQPLVERVLSGHRAELAQDDGWRATNLARDRARDALATLPAGG